MRKRVYPVLPSGPLVSLVEALGGPAECGALGTLRRAYHRAKTNGDLTVWQADELSHRLLGVHPWFVWGDEWWEEAV